MNAIDMIAIALSISLFASNFLIIGLETLTFDDGTPLNTGLDINALDLNENFAYLRDYDTNTLAGSDVTYTGSAIDIATQKIAETETAFSVDQMMIGKAMLGYMHVINKIFNGDLWHIAMSINFILGFLQFWGIMAFSKMLISVLKGSG